MSKTDKERLITGFWNRIESNQAMDCSNYRSLFASRMIGWLDEGPIEDCLRRFVRQNKRYVHRTINGQASGDLLKAVTQANL